MADRRGNGYDAPKSRREEDELDRWRLAADIADSIRLTPHGWSARIGIFAKWGEGKSTVLRFIEAILTKEENIVFWFNPWAVQDLNDLWANFGTLLIGALRANDLFVEPKFKGQLRKTADWLASRGFSKLGEGVADLFGKTKLYTGAFGLLGNWLKPDGPQIKKIGETLKGKRIVVLIDDLDRAAPDLLPKLLLSLRELLDLPGFTFLLAFDDEIVGKALAKVNEAWGDGGSFLDKILDFQHHLPPITSDAKRNLTLRMLQQHCPFVPVESTKEIEDLLPANPRKLKSLVRDLASLRSQVSRHDPEELNWVDIWLAQLLRQESYPFFDRLLLSTTLEHEISLRWRSAKNKSHSNENHNESDDGTRKLISEVGIKDAEQAENLVRLIHAVRSRASDQFRYCCELTIRPHAVTWKEFRILESNWKSAMLPETLTEWVSTHAESRSVRIADVESELFDSIFRRRDNQISAAISFATVEENRDRCTEAKLLYEMMGQFLRLPGQFTPDRFLKLYGKALHWIGFRKNTAEQSLREQEEDLIITLLNSSSNEMAPALIDALKPWEDTGQFPSDDPSVEQLKGTLTAKCLRIILEKGNDQLMKFLRQPRSIRRLEEAGRFHSFRYLLFNPNSLPWIKPVRDEILYLLRTALIDRDAYENAADLLSLLYRAGTTSIATLDNESAKRIVLDRELSVCLWAAVSSRQIQWRMQSEMIQRRRFLIDCGVSEVDLPLTPELLDRINSDSKTHIDMET